MSVIFDTFDTNLMGKTLELCSAAQGPTIESTEHVLSCISNVYCAHTFLPFAVSNRQPKKVAMGQAMERMHLTWLGSPGPNVATRNTFKVVVAIIVAYTVYSIALEIAGAPYGAYPPTWISVPRFIGSLAFTIWAIWALMKTRANVRAQYQIPEEKCKGCEDLCCSVWCSCCSVAQILRHTGEYETYHSKCLSSTGLEDGAPACV